MRRLFLLLGFIAFAAIMSSEVKSSDSKTPEMDKVKKMWCFSCPVCGAGPCTECGEWKPSNDRCSNCGTTGSWNALSCFI